MSPHQPSSLAWRLLPLLLLCALPVDAAEEDDLKTARWHRSLDTALLEPETVLKLNLSNQNLSKFPPEILRLTNLRILILNQNRISELPTDLGRLRHLLELELNQNAFTEFPRPLLGLHQLNELELSGNRITSLPADLDQLTRLTELEINQNEIATLPESLTRLVHLEQLKADQNRLTSLPSGLFALPALQDLTLSRNQLVSLPPALARAVALRKLDLSDNRLETLPADLRQLSPSVCYLWQDSLKRLPPAMLQWLLHREENDLPRFIQQLAEARREDDVLYYYHALEIHQADAPDHLRAQVALAGARAFRDIGHDQRARELAERARQLFTQNKVQSAGVDHEDTPTPLSLYNQLREADTLYDLIESEAQKNVLRARIRVLLIAALVLFAALLIALWRVHLRLRGVHTTLTEQKARIEEQATHLEKLNATKDTLFSLIGHDLRSPLAAIGALSARVRAEPAAATTPRLLGLLEGAALQLSAMLDNLLRWAQSQIRETPYEPGFIDLAELVESVLGQYRVMLAAKDIALETSITPGLHVYGDATMLATIVRNLLGNAVKFSETGCIIRITTDAREGEVALQVADTGVGMTTEQVAGLFQPESAKSLEGTRGERGTGLGLLLSHDFANRHGGRLSVRSQPGKGSIFELTLPACGLAAAAR